MYKFEIKKLSENEYQEKLVEIMKPPKGYIASHTNNRSKNYEIIDVIKMDTSMRNIAKNFINLVKVVFKKVKRW